MTAPRKIREGFSGQRLHFAGREVSEQLASHPLSAAFHALHMGWFPKAQHHFVEREEGSSESILICCLTGQGWCEIGTARRLEVGAGQAIFIPAGVSHRYGAGKAVPWSIYWAHLGGSVAGAYGILCPDDRFLLTMRSNEIEEIAALFEKCLDALERRSELQTLLFASHALRYVLGLLFLQGGLTSETGRKRDCVERSIDFMRRHLDRPLSLADMAGHVGLSPSRFTAVFRSEMDSSPVSYHIGLRMRAAAHILDNSRLTIQEIAHRTGYDDPYYFSRLFRKALGLSPKIYRMQSKG